MAGVMHSAVWSGRQRIYLFVNFPGTSQWTIISEGKVDYNSRYFLLCPPKRFVPWDLSSYRPCNLEFVIVPSSILNQLIWQHLISFCMTRFCPRNNYNIVNVFRNLFDLYKCWMKTIFVKPFTPPTFNSMVWYYSLPKLSLQTNFKLKT